MNEDNLTNIKNGDSSDDFSATIRSAARESIITNFPNPERIGCPDQALLESVAISRELPSDSLKSHLLHCSPCFVAFTELKSEIRSSETPPPMRRAMAASASSMFIVFLLLCLSVALGYIIFMGRTSEESQLAVLPERVTQPDYSTGRRQDEIDARTNSDSKTGMANDSEKKRVVDTERPEAAVTLDVGEAAVVRGEAEGESSTPVRRGKTKFNLKLVPNSPAGIYEVSIFDDSGRRIGPVQEKSSDGVTVSVVVDFSSVGENARICVALKGEIPDCFPITVQR